MNSEDSQSYCHSPDSQSDPGDGVDNPWRRPGTAPSLHAWPVYNPPENPTWPVPAQARRAVHPTIGVPPIPPKPAVTRFASRQSEPGAKSKLAQGEENPPVAATTSRRPSPFHFGRFAIRRGRAVEALARI